MDWLDQLKKSPDEAKRTRAYNIQAADAVRDKLVHRQNTLDVISSSGVKIWAGKSADPADLERDFTTPGTPGGLGCPFAAAKSAASGRGNHRGSDTPRSSLSRLSFGRRSRKPSFHDPIKAEECVSSPMSPEKSIAGLMPLCPIRFLDQHSPEEVARYFEKHQHEVPRSHEFCVKRFQENDDKVKDLNSKYANVVTMVQGLRKLHQPLLPNTEDIAVEAEEDGEDNIIHTSASKVEQWASAVSVSAQAEEPDVATDDGARETRFDRSLKDVRVGESPSRPWGIPVPDEFHVDGIGVAQKSDITASPLVSSAEVEMPGNAPPPIQCPFNGFKGVKEAGLLNPHIGPTDTRQSTGDAPPSMPKAAASASSSSATPHLRSAPELSSCESKAVTQMVFNGPVFFGYSFDQAMSALKQSGVAP